MSLTGRPGRPFPLGATLTHEGTNFAVASEVAEAMTLCLFDEHGLEHRVPMTSYDAGTWHVLVSGVGPGQAYGFRAAGPFGVVGWAGQELPGQVFNPFS